MQIRRWGSEKLVNTTTPTTGTQWDTRMVVLASGQLLITWRNLGDSSIRGQLLDPIGNPVGTELTLRADDGANITETAVTGLSDGGFYLVWNQTVGAVSYILGRVFTPAGAQLREQPVLYSFGFETGLEVSRLGSGAMVGWNTPSTKAINHRIFDGAGTGGSIETLLPFGLDSTQSLEATATTPDGARGLPLLGDPGEILVERVG
jgi:hypothetical protein